MKTNNINEGSSQVIIAEIIDDVLATYKTRADEVYFNENEEEKRLWADITQLEDIDEKTLTYFYKLQDCYDKQQTHLYRQAIKDTIATLIELDLIKY